MSTAGEHPTMLTANDHAGLGSAIEVAGRALDAGEDPYAAFLCAADGTQLQAAHNRTAGGEPTAHAELTLAGWAERHLTADARASAVLYCSAEPCPMCAGALGWVGVGRIVYAVAATTVARWRQALGHPAAPVDPVPVRSVLPATTIDGPLAADDPQNAVLAALFRRASA